MEQDHRTIRMKWRSSLANPWGLICRRDMPQEVFDLLKLTLLKGNYEKIAKKTSCVETLAITTLTSAREWLMHVGSSTCSGIEITRWITLWSCHIYVLTILWLCNFPNQKKKSRFHFNMDTSIRLECHIMYHKDFVFADSTVK